MWAAWHRDPSADLWMFWRSSIAASVPSCTDSRALRAFTRRKEDGNQGPIENRAIMTSFHSGLWSILMLN